MFLTDHLHNRAVTGTVVKWMRCMTLLEWLIVLPSVLILCTATVVYFKEEIAGLLSAIGLMLLVTGVLVSTIGVMMAAVYVVSSRLLPLCLLAPHWLGLKLLERARPSMSPLGFELWHLVLRGYVHTVIGVLRLIGAAFLLMWIIRFIR